jgi:hypothetical protein
VLVRYGSVTDAGIVQIISGSALSPPDPAWHPVGVLLRRLRHPGTGRPVLLTRALAALVVAGLLAISAPVLLPLLGLLVRAGVWVIALL